MTFYAIGLMSGTSLDGLDLCYASFTRNENGMWNFEILAGETESYPRRMERKLADAMRMSAEELYELNASYGFYLGESVKHFISRHKIKKLDVIASHGHTVFHNPKKKYTVQIGDGRAIRLLNDVPVVYDFRSADVLRGGNGAPLVPVGDQLLFSEYDACLNLGGFSNISIEIKDRRIAFDICPVNRVLNFFANKLKLPFDDGGKLAQTGAINQKVLEKLNALSYYRRKPPKSLGAEWVNAEILPLMKRMKPADALATFTAHISVQIAAVLNAYGIRNLLVTGGGAYHTFLMEELRKKTECSLVIPSAEIINYKEALIFAFMGILRLHNEINVLSSSTGSSEDHCTGILV